MLGISSPNTLLLSTKVSEEVEVKGFGRSTIGNDSSIVNCNVRQKHTMKRDFSKTIALTLGLMVMSVSISADPQLTIPNSIFSFGYVPQNSKVTTMFWLHSTGDDSLKILKVVPG